MNFFCFYAYKIRTSESIVITDSDDEIEPDVKYDNKMLLVEKLKTEEKEKFEKNQDSCGRVTSIAFFSKSSKAVRQKENSKWY